MVQPSITNVPIAPMVYTPDCSKIDGTVALSQEKGGQLAEKKMEKRQKRQKVVVKIFAVDSIFQFIRAPIVIAMETISNSNKNLIQY